MISSGDGEIRLNEEIYVISFFFFGYTCVFVYGFVCVIIYF